MTEAVAGRVATTHAALSRRSPLSVAFPRLRHGPAPQPSPIVIEPVGPVSRSTNPGKARGMQERFLQFSGTPNALFAYRGMGSFFNAHRQHHLHPRLGHWGPFPSGTLSLRPRCPAPSTPPLLPLLRTTHTRRCSHLVPAPALESVLPLPPLL